MIESIAANILVALITSKPFILAFTYTFVITVVFWALWVTINVAYNRKKRLAYRLLVYVLIIPGTIIDIFFNVTIGSLLFWELPKESTLSMRLTRYISGRTPDKRGIANYGYRVKVAIWIATNLVEPWQRGHIGLEKWGQPAARDALRSLMKRLP